MPATRWFRTGLLTCALMAAPSHAALITQPGVSASPSVVTFDNYMEFITSGPENVGAAIGATVTMNSTTPATLGALIADLGANGTWAAFVDPGSPFAAIGAPGSSSAGTMSFIFEDGPQRSVAAFLNTFAPNPGDGDLLLTALGAGNVILESHLIDVATLTSTFNEGAFFGIERAAPEITGFALTGNGFVLDNLTFSAAVPEPAAWMLMLAPAVLIGFTATRARMRM